MIPLRLHFLDAIPVRTPNAGAIASSRVRPPSHATATRWRYPGSHIVTIHVLTAAAHVDLYSPPPHLHGGHLFRLDSGGLRYHSAATPETFWIPIWQPWKHKERLRMKRNWKPFDASSVWAGRP